MITFCATPSCTRIRCFFRKSLAVSGDMSRLHVPQQADKLTCFCNSQLSGEQKRFRLRSWCRIASWKRCSFDGKIRRLFERHSLSRFFRPSSLQHVHLRATGNDIKPRVLCSDVVVSEEQQSKVSACLANNAFASY